MILLRMFVIVVILLSLDLVIQISRLLSLTVVHYSTFVPTSTDCCFYIFVYYMLNDTNCLLIGVCILILKTLSVYLCTVPYV